MHCYQKVLKEIDLEFKILYSLSSSYQEIVSNYRNRDIILGYFVGYDSTPMLILRCSASNYAPSLHRIHHSQI